MICPACGRNNIDSSAFCEQCGASLRAQPAAGAAAGAPPPPPVAPPPGAVPVSGSHIAQQGEALIAAMSLGEKISGAGAIAAIIGFFLPWFSYAVPGVAAATSTSLSGVDVGKSTGSVYLILLNAGIAAALCYLSSKALPPKKLAYAGWLVFIGAFFGPATLLALIFVSKLSTIAGAGLWVGSLGFTAVATGGLITIRGFTHRVF